MRFLSSGIKRHLLKTKTSVWNAGLVKKIARKEPSVSDPELAALQASSMGFSGVRNQAVIAQDQVKVAVNTN